MQCSVYFKGEQNPKNPILTKIKMIIYKPGYPRVEKLLPITGNFKDWDPKTKFFKANNEDNIKLNIWLSEMQKKYVTQAAEWDKKNVSWEPVHLSHFFENPNNLTEVRKKILSVAQIYDILIDRLRNERYFRNEEQKTRKSYSEKFRYNKNFMQKFVRERYGRDFNNMFFAEIDEPFLKALVFEIEKKALQNGNNGGMHDKLFLLYKVTEEAEKLRVIGANKEVFECVSDKYKTKETEPRTISYNVFLLFEHFDRSLLSPDERKWLDYYLFCFFCGGMAPVDAAYLRCPSIDMRTKAMCFERMKTGKIARPMFHHKAKEIADKYKDECYGEYVLPIFSGLHITDGQKMNRIKYVEKKVNETLARISGMLGLEEDVKFYSCRGTYITRMLDLGVHPMIIAEHCGHSPDMIYKYYFKNTKFDEVKKTVFEGI